MQPNIHSFEDLQYQNNTKIKNLDIQNTTNNNTNKIIGILAKKGQIYCSQYYCRQIIPGLV